MTAETSQYIGDTPSALWVYFPAPPTSVTSVSLVMPGGSAKIADVPIAGSAPALLRDAAGGDRTHDLRIK
ncbi:MAG TPA: hypothetical protein VGF91_02185, partial [Solirubrobacteraceae bacterium]